MYICHAYANIGLIIAHLKKHHTQLKTKQGRCFKYEISSRNAFFFYIFYLFM